MSQSRAWRVTLVRRRGMGGLLYWHDLRRSGCLARSPDLLQQYRPYAAAFRGTVLVGIGALLPMRLTIRTPAKARAPPIRESGSGISRSQIQAMKMAKTGMR